MILVSDNLRITRGVIQKAFEREDPGPIRDLARKIVAAGADALDINTGPLTRTPEKSMTFFVEAVQAETDLPVYLDTANPRALEAGLKANVNTAVVNGFSLEPAKISAILPLAKKYDVDVIGYLLHPNGHVPPDGPGRLNAALELYEAFKKTGLPDERLIIDPVVPPLAWENGNIQAMEVVEVIRTLPELLGFEVKTIAGLSNLTSGQPDIRKKNLMETAHLPMLAAAGLSHALLDVFHAQTMKVARACNALTSPGVFAWGALVP
ncbi:MAG: dihydropteroate synthase [Desulfobacterales bacterium]|nr:dihydropteroate synthase [Desulfobacterales bacterium]